MVISMGLQLCRNHAAYLQVDLGPKDPRTQEVLAVLAPAGDQISGSLGVDGQETLLIGWRSRMFRSVSYTCNLFNLICDLSCACI
jgi:hypothetical protein